MWPLVLTLQASPAKKAKALISIDASKDKIEAVRTLPGKPEERQELLPGPKGMGICTWEGGEAYESDIPNLTISSRASAKAAPPTKKKAMKEMKAMKAMKAKKKAKPAPKKKEEAEKEDDEEDDSDDEEDGESEEEGEEADGEKAKEGDLAKADVKEKKQAWNNTYTFCFLWFVCGITFSIFMIWVCACAVHVWGAWGVGGVGGGMS